MIGFLGNTLGIGAPISTATLGAKVIEKHFILDKSIESPDTDFSLYKKEFADKVKGVRDAEKLLGMIDYSMADKKRKK